MAGMSTSASKPPFPFSARTGFSLVEVLVAMALMGFVLLSISNFLVKTNVTSASVGDRMKEANEVHGWVGDIRSDLNKGVYISDNSFNERLEYTTYDNTGSAVKKIYGLCFYSTAPASTDATCPASTGANTLAYLKRSTDGGTTWGSPYRISPFNKYRLTGTPRFLYAQANNNCTSFTDTNNNGVWLTGEGRSSVACGTTTANSPYLDKPSQAIKVILNGFRFTTGKGSPESIRALPGDIFIAAPQGPVRSNTAVASPGVTDTPLVQSFGTVNASNPQFPSGFTAGGVAWDPAHERLLLGTKGSTLATMFQTERNGVQINDPLTLTDNTLRQNSLAMENDGKTAIATGQIGASYAVYRVNVDSTPPLIPYGTFLIPDATLSYFGVGFDPNAPEYVYLAYENSSSQRRIVEYNKSTGAATGNYWALPAAFTSYEDIGGLYVEPATGDFIILKNLIYTSGGSNYVNIYRITRAGASSYFSINLSRIGNTTPTGSSATFQFAYDPKTNRIFLSDRYAGRVYEVVPPVIITPRQ